MVLNEILFYGGMALVGIVLVVAIIFFVIFYIGKIKLNLKFDEEYGKVPSIKKKTLND